MAILDPNIEVVVVVCVAMLFSVLGRSLEDIGIALVFDILAAVGWFALAIVWVYSADSMIVSILFMGVGVMFVVFTIADGLEYMREAVVSREV